MDFARAGPAQMMTTPEPADRPAGARSRFRAPAWLPVLGLVLLAALPAVGILRHDFVFDSLPIIKQNPAVHSLSGWWKAFGQEYWPPPFVGLYRPISIILFAMEWAMGGGSPAVFHATSIGFYVALCLAVYRLGVRLLPQPAAWMAAALFAVHPLHTEAVASAVNQSELLVALLATSAVILYLAGRSAGPLSTGRSAAILTLYALACFIKEHAAVLPGLLLAAEWTVVQRPARDGGRGLRVFYLSAMAVGLAFIAVRGVVLEGDLVGTFTAEALAGSDLLGRLLTMLAVVPEWARLLFWPAHLQTEYTPQEITAAAGWGWGQTVGTLIIVSAVASAVAGWRHNRRVAFAILWMGVALLPVHNVLIPTGVILAERTLLLASIGAVLLLGIGIEVAGERLRHEGRPWVVPATVFIFLVLGAWRTSTRYPAWRDHFTAFAQMVVDAPLSYKAHFGHADLLAQRGQNAEAESEYRLAISLYPASPRPYQGLGDLYRRNGLCWGAIEAYDAGLAQSSSPDFDNIRRSLIACLVYVGEYRRAGAEARIGIAGQRDSVNFRRFLTTADSALAVGAPPGSVRITME